MLRDLGRRQEKEKIHTFQQTQSSIEVGLCFLLHSFLGQKQSRGAQLNVFIVFLLLSWAQEWVSATQCRYRLVLVPTHLISEKTIYTSRPLPVKCCVKPGKIV